jgi:hypothetical protein
MSGNVLPRVRGPLFCGAKLPNRDGNCRAPSGRGTSHPGWGRCKLHGGATDSHIEAAQIAQATATAQIFGVPREVDPVNGMLEIYYQTMGMLDAIEAMCMQLLPAEVVWGITKEKRIGEGGGDDAGGLTPVEREYMPGVNIWVKLLSEWHDRAFSEAERMLKLDLSARQIEYTQSQVAALVAVLMDPDLALSDGQRRVAARRLRELDSSRRTIEGSVA